MATQALSPGASIGGHRIETLIGAGGMGEVYRAHDTRLNRTVAIKVLPAATFHDPAAQQRFLREARTVAALNHPNVCSIYEVGQAGGQTFIVMEMIEGPSLDALIPDNGLPLDQAIRFGRQLADALVHAHDRGIIHRDLKPANVKIAADGTLKVLDFGLAKTGDAAADDATVNVTTPGTVLGTAAYMSPEQAEGKPVDKRTDVWAFGVVMYQMLTGRVPFPGGSFASTVAAVLRAEPEWSQVPPVMQRMLRACLEKDVKLRLRDVGDAWRLTDEPPVAASVWGRRWWIAIAAALAIGVAATWTIRRPPPLPTAPVTRWTITLVEPGGGERGVALSRDGRLLAYTGRVLPVGPIWVRPLDQLQGRPIPGTSGGRRPFFSPDGKWLAYFSKFGLSSLMKVSVAGGAPTRLCEVATFLGGTWGEDDQIIFTTPTGLMRVSASGGPCEPLTTGERLPTGPPHRYPQVLPGGKAILFGIATGENEDPRIAVLDLSNRQQRILEQRGAVARYVSSGHLVYVRNGTIYAVPFDLQQLKPVGPEVVAIDGVWWSENGSADYTVSESGTLVYTSSDTVHRSLAWIDRAGGNLGLSAAPLREYGSVSLSPDGRRAATFLTAGGPGILIVDLERGTVSQISPTGNFPIWTADGSRIVYGIPGGVASAPADGSGPPVQLAQEPPGGVDSILPDGTLMYTVSSSAALRAPSFIKMLPLAGRPAVDGRSALFSKTNHNEGAPRLSPDGKWIAYVSDESGKKQVYLRAYQGTGEKVPVSIEGGDEPRWAGNSGELFFRDAASNQLMTVDLAGLGRREIGRPRALFPLATSLWDVAPDGKRFLVVKDPDPTTELGTVQVVGNWFEELRQKTGASR